MKTFTVIAVYPKGARMQTKIEAPDFFKANEKASRIMPAGFSELKVF